MYDLEGTDSDREWLEVMNNGSESVNLSDWKFFENNSNHSLTMYSGDESLAPGAFAVIVDVPETFLANWPNFSGTMFDSSWSSFSNTGETFALKNEDGDIVDEFTYVPEDGANGDGKSLQLIGGTFVPASPTPGAENQAGTGEGSGGGVETETSQTTEVASDQIDIPSSTFGIPTRVIVGERIDFEPEFYDDEGQLIFKAEFHWNFGDGATRVDEYRKDFSHTFAFPGSYVVYVEIFTGASRHEPNYIFRQSVQVLSAQVELALIDGGISIKNKSVYELDLGKWDIVSGNEVFRIPEKTFVLPGKSITFPSSVLGISSVDFIVLRNELDATVASIGEEKSAEPVQQVKEKIVYVPVQQKVQSVVQEVSVIESQEEADLENKNQLAQASSAIPEKIHKNWIWYLIYGILLFAIVGVVGYVYFRQEESGGGDDNEYNEVDEYTFE